MYAWLFKNPRKITFVTGVCRLLTPRIPLPFFIINAYRIKLAQLPNICSGEMLVIRKAEDDEKDDYKVSLCDTEEGWEGEDIHKRKML